MPFRNAGKLVGDMDITKVLHFKCKGGYLRKEEGETIY
jgi:hypothetical protein